MYLGLDLGTSGLKALLIDSQQRIVESVTAPLTVSRLHSGWSEQDPAHWIEAAEQVLFALKAKRPHEFSALEGIGLSGQMHGATLLDDEGRVLRPCILWNDTRSHQQAARLDADPRFRSIPGNIVFPGFTAPKLVWVKEHEPDIFGHVAKVLLPKDYLRYWLTGDYVAEMSDAAGTSWLDTGKRCWSEELLHASSMDLSQMPSLVEGSDVSGTLRRELAAHLGIKGEVVVAGGGGDNAASAIGTGIVHPGAAFVSLGTSGVLFASNERYLPNPDSAVHAFCHAVPQTWHQMGVILSATAALQWLGGVVGEKPSKLTAQLGDDVQPPTSLLFLPYLSGERTPHNDASIRGAFVGLGHGSDRAAMTRAVVEGVCFALRDNQEALRTAGTELDGVIAVGGGSRSTYWLKLIANTLNLPVHIPAEGDFGAAFGAARLGLMAATGADATQVCTPPRIAQTIEPEHNLVPLFEQQYGRYTSLYPALTSWRDSL